MPSSEFSHMASSAKASASAAQQYYLWPAQRQESKQFLDFCWIDLAHVVMLVEEGTISELTGRKLLPALKTIRDRGFCNLPIDPNKESLLFQVESALAAQLGDDIAGSLHTARSRIDQRATAGRMYYRTSLLSVMDRLHDFQEELLSAAMKYSSNIIPYYTHMQQAQPGNFGHYLLAFVAKFQEDLERCRAAFHQVNRNPLGTVGRSGTGLQINRHRTTELLGFDEQVYNSLLGRDADYSADIVAALSFVMYHLNDLATDLHIWSTNEFGFIQLPETYCATSSIFPHKRNPVTLETIKCAAGPSVTWLTSTLATFRGEGTGDHKVHGVASCLDQAADTTTNMLILAGKIVGALDLKQERISQTLAESWSTTNNLADNLMQNHHLSIRQAHQVVARVVKTCRDSGIPRSGLTPDLLKTASRDILGKEISMSRDELSLTLDPEAFVRTRISAGSVGPSEVQKMILSGEDMLSENRKWAHQKREQFSAAQLALDDAIAKILHDVGQ